MTTIESNASGRIAVTRLALYGMLSAVIASIVNGLVRVAALSLFHVPAGYAPLGWGPVINTTVIGVVGATGLYGLLTRFSTQPNRAFVRIAIAVLILSFGPLLVPPAFLAEAPVSVLLTLGGMHVTTAAVVVSLLPRTLHEEVASR